MFSALTSWMQSGEEATQSLFARAGLGIETAVKEQVKDVPDAEYRVETPPAPWTSAGGTAAEWLDVVEALLSDENTFLIAGPRLLAEAVGIHDALRQCSSAYDTFVDPVVDFEAIQNRVGPLSRIAGVPDMHYALVPKYVSDTQFWLNVSWRLDVLQHSTPGNVVSVIRLLNTEPRGALPEGSARQKNIGVETNNRMLADLERRLAASREASEWVATKRETITADLASCRSNGQLLVNLTNSMENGHSVELADSVADSCTYHKTKIAGHIAELDSRAEQLQSGAPDLAPSQGPLYVDLLDVNIALRDALAQYTTWRSQILNDKPATVSSPTASAAAQENNNKRTSPKGEDEPSLRGSRGPVSATEDAKFSATVPWDDEDE